MTAQPRHPRIAGQRTAAAPETLAVPRPLAIAAAWSWRLLVVGALAYLVVTFLAGIPVVSVPIFLALLLSALLHRPAALLRRVLPDWLAALTVLIGAAVVIGGIGYFVTFRVQSNAATLADQAQHVVDQLRRLAEHIPGVGGGSGDLLGTIQDWVKSHSATLVSGALAAGRVLAELVTGLVLTVFLTLFFLMDGEREWQWVVRLLPARARPVVNGAGHRAFSVLSGWIWGTAIIAVIHAVVIGVTLWLLGTPLVIVLAVLVFIGSFIPIIGAFVFGGLSVLVTLVAVGLWPAVILLGVLLAENLLEGHVYQPLIMGRTVRLHPVIILVALTVGGVLAGIMGAIAAIPVAAAVSAAVKYASGAEDIDGNAVPGAGRPVPEPPRAVQLPRARGR
ncbi:MAG TPA: AI-2E family transporter [Nakamurella sp.]|nr:AI-2E family transporter [Nakamurella sp.]